MEFDFTQMRRTLKKVLVEIRFKHVMMRLQAWRLSKHSRQGLITIEVESDLFDPK